MQTTLPLDKMSTEEKIQAMESIWDDLCKNEDSFQSPLWHGDILLEREEKLKKGSNQFVDWEKAKKNIRGSIS